MRFEFGFSLFTADLRDDLSRFHLLHYGRRMDGFLVSGHNSGTHWLRFMLSSAIAHRLGLPRPAFSSGPHSDIYIGHARHPRKFAHAPRIGSSHHMPSRLIAILGALGLVRLPPVVLLVRRLPDSLISYFFKWRETKKLGALTGYVARAPSAQGVDVWWFIRFFNRWDVLRRAFPNSVLVVRYEDVARDPETWVRRIWAHWGVELTEGDLAAAMAVSSREVIQAHIDPAYGEDIAPNPQARLTVQYSDRDLALLERRLTQHLRCDFGYGQLSVTAEPRHHTPAHEETAVAA